MKIATAGNGYTRFFFCPACRTVHSFKTDSQGWGFNDDVEKPTITPSLRITYPGRNDYVCHSVITDGKIAYCGDCTHAYAGKTVSMEDFPYDRYEIT